MTTVTANSTNGRWIMVAVFLLFANAAAYAENTVPSVDHWGTFLAAGQRYGIDPFLLVAIAKVESNVDQQARNVNRDGSVDVGIMQINRRYWEEPLSDLGIAWQRVESSAETNINVGAWVLAQSFTRVGVSWEAVGAYNAGFSAQTEHARRRYATKVYASLKQLWRTASTDASTLASLRAERSR